MVSVPYANAATPCAPPQRYTSLIPNRYAAASVGGWGLGEITTILLTPATCLQAYNNRQSRAAARFARALLRKFFCSTIAAPASSQSGECSPRPASEHGGFQQALPSTQARFHWLKPAGPAALVRYPTMWHIEVKPCRRPCERPAQSCALQVLLHPVATAAARAVRPP